MSWRAIHDSVRDSESLSDLSHVAERVFWRIIAQSDAWGRMRGEARKVRANCCPMVAITDDEIETALGELERSGRIVRHGDGDVFLQVVDFDEHQPAELRRRRSPSRFPEAPASSGSSPGLVRERSERLPAQSREEESREPSSPSGEEGGAPGAVRERSDDPVFDPVGHFVDEVRRVTGRDPLANAKSRLGKHASDLRKQDVTDDVIRNAITEVVEAGLTVGAILTVADQIHRGGYRGRNGNGARDGLSVDEILKEVA